MNHGKSPKYTDSTVSSASPCPLYNELTELRYRGVYAEIWQSFSLESMLFSIRSPQSRSCPFSLLSIKL
jgi:hypothetical protein